MLLRYFYDKTLAQASYLVGCAVTGEALVIDPMRDIQPYLQAAQDEGFHIAHIAETHIHADYVSGGRELAAHTGGKLYLSAEGGPDWTYAFDDGNVTLVRDGDAFMVGNVRMEVIHTPGHTLEHIAFILTDTAGADRPMGVFTGDFVFVGDIGRPDLLEEAAGYIGTKEIGARQMFATLQRFKALPDYLQIWPAHGAGSACGKALGAVPSTTLGYEKLFSPAFQIETESEFVEWLLDGQPEPPRYFAQMKKVNKLGAPLLKDLSDPKPLSLSALEEVLAVGHLVVDLRSREDYARNHIPGTLNVPATGTNYTTYVGWFVDYEQPTALIIPDEASLSRILTDLRAIGVDNIAGYITGADLPANGEALDVMSLEELAARLPQRNFLLLDVRGKTEHAEKHIAGAHNIAVGLLPRHLDELPHDRLIVTQCATGYRSQVAASYLRGQGFKQVMTLNASDSEWSRRLPVETGEAEKATV